ncbi:unnamed protein product, partial [marine sediment metagenome]
DKIQKERFFPPVLNLEMEKAARSPMNSDRIELQEATIKLLLIPVKAAGNPRPLVPNTVSVKLLSVHLGGRK